MTDMSFKIVEFNKKYQAAVVDLVGGLLVYTGAIAKSDLPIDDEDLMQIPQTYSGLGGFWMAISKDRLIGTVGLRDMGNGLVKLKRMFVLPEFHGQGVGQALLNYAIDKARERGFTRVILNTNEHMIRAHHFYEKNGFIKTGQDGTQLHYERGL